MGTTASQFNHALPTATDAALAEESIQILENYLKVHKQPSILLTNREGKTQQVNLPPSAFKLLIKILSEMAEGNAVSLMPIHSELTTQEAADLLNVSRPYLITLLDSGQIPHRKVGTRRRVLAKDILHYKARNDENRLRVLKELSKQAQDLKMGYE